MAQCPTKNPPRAASGSWEAWGQPRPLFLLERAGAGGIWSAADRVPYKTEPLFPYQIFQDSVFILLVFLVLASLAVLFPAPLEPQADPTDSTYNPRPEWYFYFVFQLLKIFEGRFELVGPFLIPNLGIMALLLLPFLDRGPDRNPAKRKLMMAAGGIGSNHHRADHCRCPRTHRERSCGDIAVRSCGQRTLRQERLRRLPQHQRQGRASTS